MSGPARVEFDLTADDFVACHAIILPRDPFVRENKRKLRPALVAVLVFGWLLGGLVFVVEMPPLEAGSLIGFLGLIFAALAWPTESRARKQFTDQARRMATFPMYRSALVRRTYDLHSHWLSVQTTHGHFEWYWQSVIATYRTADYFVVVFPGPFLAPFPRDAFETDDAFDTLADEVERRIVSAGGSVGEPEEQE
jgi:hypothetical protein